MRFSRWIDHLPPWMAYGATVSTGVYETWEQVLFPVPLLLGALVESLRLDLGRWRRWLEVLALLIFLADIFSPTGRRNPVVVAVHTLFVLCGVRLILPRELPQRRQLLFMGFLLFLTTAVTTADLGFMAWAAAWVAGASLVLLQLAWEHSAQLRRGPIQRAPLGRTFRWSAGVLALAGGFFLVLPRTALALRPMPFSLSGLTNSRAGLSETLELGGLGPIGGNSEVVMRVIPPPDLSSAARDALADRYALLRGLALEQLDGMTWQPRQSAWQRRVALTGPAEPLPGGREVEIYVAPSTQLIVALPYGESVGVQWPAAFPLRTGPGDSVRWLYPPNRWLSLEVATRSSTQGFFLPEDGRWLQTRRFPNLTFVPEEAEAAHRWSLGAAPASLPPAELKSKALAERLSRELRDFAYTTANPSGRAANPLQDFLENSRAGHCEYFASALAFMLRSRGVPARVVNGYRLGPWSEEGGYFLVTQDQAHAWVEYYDSEAQGWRVADPTPPAPPLPGATGWRAAFSRWADAAQYRWDRHVVRFSDDDQVEGLAWIKRQALALPSWRPGRREAWLAGGGVLLVLLLAGGRRWARPAPAVGAFHPLRTLRPLVKRAGQEAPPRPGETARAWLLRLATLRPALGAQLQALAEAVDAAAYGGASEASLKAPARALARAWKDADRAH